MTCKITKKYDSLISGTGHKQPSGGIKEHNEKKAKNYREGLW